MGMFDYINCEAPLPATETPPPNSCFQTKDTPDQGMTIYTITSDGFLMWRPYVFVEVPKEDRPHPNDDGLLGLMGSRKRVEESPERLMHHGDICFYTLADECEDGGWWEYCARFNEGALVRITLVEYRASTPSRSRGACDG